MNDLESREKSYIQRLSDLDQQLQHEKEKNETLFPLQDHNDEINNLMKKVEELTIQQEKLNVMLITKVKLFTKEKIVSEEIKENIS
jgi:hypothetical protein